MGASPISAVHAGASRDASVVGEASQPTARITAVNTQHDTVALSATAHALELHREGDSVVAIATVLDASVATVESYLKIQAAGASTGASVASQAAQSNARTTATKTQQHTVTLKPNAHALELYREGDSPAEIAAVLDTTVAMIQNYLDIQAPTIPTTKPLPQTPGISSSIKS